MDVYFLEVRNNIHSKCVMCFFLTFGHSMNICLCLPPCRYLFNKKKRLKIRRMLRHICATYIVKEISIIISYYLEPHMLTRINCVSIHDDVGAMSFGGNVSIFSHSGQPLLKNTVSRRYLTNIEFR